MIFTGKYRGLVILLILILVGLNLIEIKAQNKRLSKKEEESRLQDIETVLGKDPLKALDLLGDYLQRNFKTISKQEEAEVYHLIGRANFALNQYELAIENYLKAMNTRSAFSKYREKYSSNFTKKIAIPKPALLKDLGLAYAAKEDWGNSITYLQTYVDALDNADPYQRCEALVLLGETHLKSGQIDHALRLGRQADSLRLSISDEQGNTVAARVEIQSAFLIGSALELKNDYNEALLSLRRALSLAETIGDDNLINEISDIIGSVLKKQNNYLEELDFKKDELQKSVQRNDLTRQNTLNLDIAQIYLENDKSEEAVPFLQSSVNISEQLNDLETNVQARKSLSGAYTQQGNYNAALNNYRDYVDLVDQLYENKQKEIQLSNQVQQDLFRKQETINLLEKDMRLNQNKIQLLEKDRALNEEYIFRQRLLIYGLILFILIILGSAFLLYRNVRQKRLANQLLALKSLRSQMNPHFIFNALNSVNSFISKNDTRKANKYLSDFSRLMRTVMENSQCDFVPLSDEIETLKLYLKLEHFRFRDKFDYSFSVSDKLAVDEFRIPPMLIQPYIENAIWHGLRYREEKGFLSVSINSESNSVVMTIEDDGIGREQSKALKTNNQKIQKSTGMKNTENRIQLINDTYHSSINFSIEDINGQNATGTRVTVKIPRELIEETV
ncbi:histidine kinase [Fulvivirgaceae bacterium BMA10]|uniref:Histidine kinase n=1 Tax=Splendidivirga corallicola TaxID=3051826 RepID=A0ABT8KWC0_9BACT|nr:histidine kinase [Fulvivirgaceae bacterium BMA10]